MQYRATKDAVTAIYADGKGYSKALTVLEDDLRDLYIIGQDERNWQDVEMPTSLQEYVRPESVPTSMSNIDWYGLRADVFDQFGEKMLVVPTWTIEGAGASVVDGRVVEDEVVEPTTYEIVVKVGDLEQRQSRTVYPPPVDEPYVDPLEARVAELEQVQDALLGVTNG